MKMEKEYYQSNELKEKVEQLIQIALTLPEHLQKKVINVGMIGEIKSCALMNWTQSVCVNNPGFDAIDSKKNFIQIKTYMTGNKTKMIPAFNPDLKKNKTVDKRTKRFDMTLDDFQLIHGIEINCI
jgi:hypothetical protein